MRKVCLVLVLLLGAPVFAGAFSLQEIPTEYAKIGKVEIAYKVIGEGEPLLVFNGFSVTMPTWDPEFIQDLSRKYRVILFDYRGMGASKGPSGSKFSFKQCIQDASRLLDVLGIEKAHVLGWSMGTFIGQLFAIDYPEKVDHLVLYSAECGGVFHEIPPPLRDFVKEAEVFTSGKKAARSFNISTEDPAARKKTIQWLVPEKWLEEHPGFEERFPVTDTPLTAEQLEREIKAIDGWSVHGTYHKLKHIKAKLLLITGTEDIVIPARNSLIIAGKVPGSWLVRLEGGGHGAMYQFPHEMAKIILMFLED